LASVSVLVLGLGPFFCCSCDASYLRFVILFLGFGPSIWHAAGMLLSHFCLFVCLFCFFFVFPFVFSFFFYCQLNCHSLSRLAMAAKHLLAPSRAFRLPSTH
jgi:hypothetical protein